MQQQSTKPSTPPQKKVHNFVFVSENPFLTKNNF